MDFQLLDFSHQQLQIAVGTQYPNHFMIYGLPQHFFYIPNVLRTINLTITIADTSNKETDINNTREVRETLYFLAMWKIPDVYHV